MFFHLLREGKEDIERDLGYPLGSVVMAWVRVMPGVVPGDALARELQGHVKCNPAPYKYPRVVEFVDQFPLTSSGNISRRTLRARAAGKE